MGTRGFAENMVLGGWLLHVDEWPLPSTLFDFSIRSLSTSGAMLTWLAPRVSQARFASADWRSIPFFFLAAHRRRVPRAIISPSRTISPLDATFLFPFDSTSPRLIVFWLCATSSSARKFHSNSSCLCVWFSATHGWASSIIFLTCYKFTCTR